MPTPTALAFRQQIERLRAELAAVPPSLSDVAWRPGGWTRKQIVGHLLDSAANNRQRFVRASIDGAYTGPSYAQEAWVAAHGYAELPWPTLVQWWNIEHDILLAVVDRVPEHRLAGPCTVGSDAPVTLGFLIEDYVRHQQHHFRQIQAPPPHP